VKPFESAADAVEWAGENAAGPFGCIVDWEPHEPSPVVVSRWRSWLTLKWNWEWGFAR
jgi:hypothetical protein